MNKKILIASLFSTLMLLVPTTSVVGVSDVEEDCDCVVVNRYDLFRVKLLLVRIKVFTNLLLLRFGHIPEVAEKCQEILTKLNILGKPWPDYICDILSSICNLILELMARLTDYGDIGRFFIYMLFPFGYVLEFLLLNHCRPY